MNQTYFQTDDAVTLIGAGCVEPAVLRAAMALAPRVVAADGGADIALAQGVSPEAVIGDFDSLSPQVRGQVPPERLFPIPEQDSTDFDKALRSIQAPMVIGVGFDGDRLDHMLASFSTLLARPERKCLLLTKSQLVFLCPPRIRIPMAKGGLVSLYPLGPVQGASEGLEWPIAGVSFAPDRKVGTSNRALGPIQLTMDAPRMLVILPRGELADTFSAVQSAAGWPARGR